jgi:hypothetical protein
MFERGVNFVSNVSSLRKMQIIAEHAELIPAEKPLSANIQLSAVSQRVFLRVPCD